MDQILLGRDIWIKNEDGFDRAEIVIVDNAGNPGISVIFSDGNKKGILNYYSLGEIVNNTCFSFCKPDSLKGFKVTLKSIDKLIPTIKIIRSYTNYGLKEAKDFFDSVKISSFGFIDHKINLVTGENEPLNKETAQKLYSELKAIGCDVEISVGS